MILKYKNLIIFFSALIVLLGLVVGTELIFNPIKNERLKQETLSTLKIYFDQATDFETNTLETIDGVEITRSVRVYNDVEPLGYLYEANMENAFGNIRIRLVVEANDTIAEVIFVELNQTMYQQQTKNIAEQYVFQKLKGSITDASAGATSYSIQTLVTMIQTIGSHHDQTDKFDIKLPYQDYYGEGYVVEDSTNLTIDGAQVKKETVTNKGIVYTISKSGIYNSDVVTEKEITVIVVLDTEGQILAVLLPTDLYQHTKGNFYNNALEFAQSFVGKTFDDVLDGQAGATTDPGAFNSRSLILDILLIAKGDYLA
ncbi:Uncharacterised protein [Acholeplasma oculi]|uniref:FMN-binding domain-containing protein n=1 Tax=Acholeplasma oculi TaxID=35623 RepID=A0A061AC64_9MOLU|nr:hypothetical protein [Acholeplasma oculi]CDR31465.1 hypothetical protein Aocu_13920 [Acholeplasma oculi]SKC49042.1 hypothetical protein SAMN02745122_1370 [Acholeplasma oculi]SUT92145.1 Uncharacterised protein [Acholeplasma oculi]